MNCCIAVPWPAALAPKAPRGSLSQLREPPANPVMTVDLASRTQGVIGRGPAPPGFHGIPTREQRIAESERVLVRYCVESRRDPEQEGLGIHGRLIGGHGKPTRVHYGSRPFENYCRPVLAPVSWFLHPGGRRTSGRSDAGHLRLRHAIASCMAGTPQVSRPSGAQLHAVFLKECPEELERFWLHSVLSGASIRELRNILYFEGLPLYVIVRAVHLSGSLTHRLCNWLNQFAVDPGAAG